MENQTKKELSLEFSVGGEASKGMQTELKARKILGGENDGYKQGFNDAMDWAIRMVRRYEKGEGLFQS